VHSIPGGNRTHPRFSLAPESRLDSPPADRKLTPLFSNIMSQQLRPVVKRARRKAYLKRKKEAAKLQKRSAKK